MAKPIHIGNRLYKTKKSAGDAVRDILYAYQIGDTISDEHACFMAHLLELHAEREQKIGAGIASFQVEQNIGSRGFWITRVDGTRTDFSFLSCLTPRTPEMEARAAFRTEVREQIQDFKEKEFLGVLMIACPVTLAGVSKSTAHVDHFNPTFEELLAAFLDGAPLTSVAVQPTADGETDTRLSDNVLAERWRSYHQENAKLRIVSRKANLSLLRRGIKRSGK